MGVGQEVMTHANALCWPADNVLALDVVNTWEYNTTGKLEVVTVSATSYPDLFWGLRVRANQKQPPQHMSDKHPMKDIWSASTALSF